MALIRRMSKLFSADLHAVLDRMEEPEVLLKQAIRDMEEELAKQEQRIKWLRREKEQLTSREHELHTTPVEIDKKLDLCFEGGKDDLAKKLIRRKLQAERLAQHVKTKHEAAAKTLAEYEADLEENQERLEGMRQRAECFVADASVERAERSFADADLPIGEDEVEVAYLREKQRRSKS